MEKKIIPYVVASSLLLGQKSRALLHRPGYVRPQRRPPVRSRRRCRCCYRRASRTLIPIRGRRRALAVQTRQERKAAADVARLSAHELLLALQGAGPVSDAPDPDLAGLQGLGAAAAILERGKRGGQRVEVGDELLGGPAALGYARRGGDRGGSLGPDLAHEDGFLDEAAVALGVGEERAGGGGVGLWCWR